MDFLEEKMWETAASGTQAPLEPGGTGSVGSQMSRCVVRMRRPDFRRTEKLTESSDSNSTLERNEHSISLGRRTGRPLLVSSASGRWCPAINGVVNLA